jgi:F0F1-type ATP synthase assembly protein I
MGYLVLKAALSGVIVAVASEVARRHAVLGALIASLPLVSLLAILWLWRDTGDVQRVADHMTGTLWYVLPSLPMFLLVPALLHRGWGFWAALGLGCLLTVLLYGLAAALLARLGPGA